MGDTIERNVIEQRVTVLKTEIQQLESMLLKLDNDQKNFNEEVNTRRSAIMTEIVKKRGATEDYEGMLKPEEKQKVN